MVMGKLFVKVHLTAGGHGRFEVTLFGDALLEVRNQFENAVLGLSRGLFLFVPVRDRTSQINSLYLLDECANDFIVLVANGPHAYEVDQNDANDVFACDSSMFLREFLVAYPRYNELVLARLTPINVVVSVEK